MSAGPERGGVIIALMDPVEALLVGVRLFLAGWNNTQSRIRHNKGSGFNFPSSGALGEVSYRANDIAALEMTQCSSLI